MWTDLQITVDLFKFDTIITMFFILPPPPLPTLLPQPAAWYPGFRTFFTCEDFPCGRNSLGNRR